MKKEWKIVIIFSPFFLRWLSMVLNKFRFIGIDILRRQKCAFYWILLKCLSMKPFFCSLLGSRASFVRFSHILMVWLYMIGALSVFVWVLWLRAVVRTYLYLDIFAAQGELNYFQFRLINTLVLIYFCVIDRPKTSKEVIGNRTCIVYDSYGFVNISYVQEPIQSGQLSNYVLSIIWPFCTISKPF